jgi:hypothetical protein
MVVEIIISIFDAIRKLTVIFRPHPNPSPSSTNSDKDWERGKG